MSFRSVVVDVSDDLHLVFVCYQDEMRKGVSGMLLYGFEGGCGGVERYIGGGVAVCDDVSFEDVAVLAVGEIRVLLYGVLENHLVFLVGVSQTFDAVKLDFFVSVLVRDVSYNLRD